MKKNLLTFKIVMAIQICISLLFLGALGYTFIISPNIFKGQMLINLVITTIVIIIPLLFCFTNIYIFQKNYPNNIFSIRLKNIFIILYVLYCICGFIFLVTVSMGIYDTARSFMKGSKNTQAIYIMSGMVIFLISIIYILFQSIRLKKIIHKNAQLKELELNTDEKDILSSIIIKNYVI